MFVRFPPRVAEVRPFCLASSGLVWRRGQERRGREAEQTSPRETEQRSPREAEQRSPREAEQKDVHRCRYNNERRRVLAMEEGLTTGFGVAGWVSCGMCVVCFGCVCTVCVGVCCVR